MSEASAFKKIQKKPGQALAIGACVLLAVGTAFYGLQSLPKPVPPAPAVEAPRLSILQGSGAEKFLADGIQDQLKKHSQALAELKQSLETFQADQSANVKPLDVKPTDINTPETGSLLASASPVPSDQSAVSSVLPPTPLSATGIEVSSVELKPLSKKPSKNADSFVPAGTFVQAVMLGAADASAGVTSQANPSPMLFRLTAEGELPHHVRSHLKDCVVTAAVIGDISSERGQVRLERLSCTFPSGEIVEQPVEGTVFALDAKNGVRGRPVWREGSLLARATFAGALSGLAGSLNALTAPSSKATPTTALSDTLLKTTGVQGAGSALDKLAAYHIQRAEQYHPVIQLSAGQAVDVVFLKGFYLDGRKIDENNKPSEADLFAEGGNTQSDATGLTLSEEQIDKIKQHEAALGWEAGRT